MLCVSTRAGQRLGGVAGQDRHPRLPQDRTVVQLGGHLVHSAPGLGVARVNARADGCADPCISAEAMGGCSASAPATCAMKPAVRMRMKPARQMMSGARFGKSACIAASKACRSLTERSMIDHCGRRRPSALALRNTFGAGVVGQTPAPVRPDDRRSCSRSATPCSTRRQRSGSRRVSSKQRPGIGNPVTLNDAADPVHGLALGPQQSLPARRPGLHRQPEPCRCRN